MGSSLGETAASNGVRLAALPDRRGAAGHMLLLVLVGAAIFLPCLGQVQDIHSREPRHAEIAREMLEQHEYLAPRLLGEPYVLKPPLFNWAQAGLFALSGRVDFAMARLPSALAAILAAVGVYLLGRRWLGPRAALRSGLIWLTFPMVVIWGQTARADMMMTCLVVYAMLLVSRSADASGAGARWGFWGGACVLVAAAVMSKGPQALFFFAVAVPCVWRAQRGRWLPPVRLVLGALALFVLGAAAWLVVYEVREPGYVEGLLHYQFGRGLSEHRAPLYYYGQQLLVLTVPWSFFAVAAAVLAVRRLRRTGIEPAAVPALVLAVALALMTAFPNKRGHYLLPILPMWALLVSGYLDKASGGAAGASGRVLFRWPLWGMLAFLVAAGMVGVVGFGWVLAGMPPLAAIASAAVGGLAAGGLVVMRRGRAGTALSVLLAASVVLAAATFPAIAHLSPSPNWDIRAIDALGRQVPREAPLGAWKVTEELVFFRLNRSVHFMQKVESLKAFVEAPGTKYLLLPPKEIDAGAVPASGLTRLGVWEVGNHRLALIRITR